MANIIVMQGTSKLAERIQQATDSKWSHAGMCLDDNYFLDFSHDAKRIRHIDELFTDSKVASYAILSDRQTFFDDAIILPCFQHWRNAQYDAKAIFRLAQKLKRGRDGENLHVQDSTHYGMHCASLIAYVYDRPHLDKFFPFPFHYSQAIPADFYESFEKVAECTK